MLQPVVLIYIGLYLLALALAVWHRKTFPLSDALMVTLIVGFGFTLLVYLIAPHSQVTPTRTAVSLSELLFTLAYLVITAVFLAFGWRLPANQQERSIKIKLYTLGYKLLLFVVFPLVFLRLGWNRTWAELGFSAGNAAGQMLASALLILIFGAFNLLAGSAAKPIRARQFSARQLAAGMSLASLWNILEVGLVEEFYFRAFVQGRLAGYLGSPVAGICLASLLFGLAHAPGIYLRRGDEHGPLGATPTLLNSILYAILALSPTGWFTGLLYWRAQSLLAPILVHAAVDAVAHTPEFIEELGIQK
jgi:membrane protease YdiL (CAAX protease family)